MSFYIKALKTKFGFILAAWVLHFATNASATPKGFSYTGRLTENNGKPLKGKIDIEINFYDSAIAINPFHEQEFRFYGVELKVRYL